MKRGPLGCGRARAAWGVRLSTGAIAVLWGLGAMAWDPPAARAGGIEVTVPGTRALGRGGAFYASRGPMSLLYNPAALALSERLELSLQSHLILYRACHDRSGTYAAYGEGFRDLSGSATTIVSPDSPSAFGTVRDSAGVAHPQVCRSGAPGPSPNVVLTAKLGDRVGLGIGLLSPAAVGSGRWGDRETVQGREYEGIVDGLPAPTRYNLIEQNNLGIAPTIGLGVAATDWLRFGASFGWGIASFSFDNQTLADRGEEWAEDVFSELTGTDLFVPRITASAHATPLSGLDIGLTFSWEQSVDATGDLTLTSGYYNAPGQGPGPGGTWDTLSTEDVEIDVPRPWVLALGVRYGHLRGGRGMQALPSRAEQASDPMVDEVFDIELAVVWERNSLVDFYEVRVPRGASGDPLILLLENGLPLEIPNLIRLDHFWKDQVSVRLGADWNVLPGKLAVRAGVLGETRGVGDGLAQLDFLPMGRLALSAGLTARFGKFELSVGYARVFQFAIDIGRDEQDLIPVTADYLAGQQRCIDAPGCDPAVRTDVLDQTSTPAPTFINAGRFTSSADVFSVGLGLRFGAGRDPGAPDEAVRETESPAGNGAPGEPTPADEEPASEADLP